MGVLKKTGLANWKKSSKKLAPKHPTAIGKIILEKLWSSTTPFSENNNNSIPEAIITMAEMFIMRHGMAKYHVDSTGPTLHSRMDVIE